MHAALLRIQYARGMKVFPWCTCIILVACTDLCIKACFHPSESTVDPPTPPVQSCGHLCGSSLRLCRGTEGKHGRDRDGCRCLQSAGMPDGVLIDFLALSQFFITPSPSWCQRCAAEDLCFWDSPLLRWALVTCALEIWFMNGSQEHKHSFWQQKQIMEEIEWSNLWLLPYH